VGAPAAAVRSAGASLPALAWAIVAVVCAAAGGVLVAEGSPVALDVVLAGVTALAIARGGFAALVAIVLLIPADKPFIEFLVVTGGAAFLIVVMRRLPAKRVVLPWIAFAMLALASVPWTPSFEDVPSPRIVPLLHKDYLPTTSTEANEWLVLVFALVLFLLAAWLVRERRRLEVMVGVILVGSLWPIAEGLREFAAGGYNPATQANAAIVNPRSNYHAIQGLFIHPNPFGFYLVAILTIAVVAFFEAKRTALRLGILLVIATGGFCLLNTYTRSAWLAFAMAILLLGVFRYRVLLIAGVLLLPLASFAAPGAVRDVAERFGDLTSSSAAHESNSLDWRRDQWSRMLPLGSDKPLTGQGFGSYQRLTISRFGFQDKRFRTVSGGRPVGFTAHNDYVKTFVEMGYPGLILWILVLVGLVSAMVVAARAPGVAPWAAAMAVVGAVTIGLGNSDNLQAGYSVVFMAIVATLSGAVAGAAFWTRSEHQPAS
jgi:O-antigen ligase